MTQCVCEIWCNVCVSSAHASNASNVRTINVCASKARASQACVSHACNQSESVSSANICHAETMNAQHKNLHRKSISTSICKSNTRNLKYRHPQCKHNASMCTANANIRDVNTIRNHVQCKEKQCTFAMKIPEMSRHLKCKSKQCTSYPCVSKACASNVRMGNGFGTQVLACGIALCGSRRA